MKDSLSALFRKNRFEVRIVCTDEGAHPSRELALLIWRGGDPDRTMWEQLRTDGEVDQAEAEIFQQYEKVDVVARRASRRGAGHGVHVPVFMARVLERELPADEAGVMEKRGSLFRFQCRTCRLDVPMRQDRVNQLLAGLAAAGVSTFDLSRARR